MDESKARQRTLKADLLTSAAVCHLLSYRKSLRLVDLRTVGFRGAGLQLLAESDLSGLDWPGLSMLTLRTNL